MSESQRLRILSNTNYGTRICYRIRWDDRGRPRGGTVVGFAARATSPWQRSGREPKESSTPTAILFGALCFENLESLGRAGPFVQALFKLHRILPPAMSKHLGAFKRVAIAGALKSGEGGHTTGAYIAKAILELNKFKPGTFDEVLIIGRGELKDMNKIKQASAKEFLDMGAKYKSIDYNDEAGMVAALRGVQCVISCLSVADPEAIGKSEIALVRASAKAGVTRYFPSQYVAFGPVGSVGPLPTVSPSFACFLRYGPDDENLPSERIWRISKRKRAVIDEVLKCGMEYTAVVSGLGQLLPTQLILLFQVTGIYYDVIWAHQGVFHWQDENGKAKGITVGPDGVGTVMSISLDDIGNYIAAMISDADQSNTRNKTVRIFVESWKTGDDIKIFEEVTGRKVEIERYPLGDGVKDRSAYPQYPRLIAHNHYWIDPNLNDIGKWPHIKPKGMKAWLKEKLANDELMRFQRARSARPEATGKAKM